MQEKVQLINHASIFIKIDKDMSILSDPWYEGQAFDNGWSLLHQNNEKFILKTLEETNYIYISHEHPDHFSISFFKKYSKLIKEKNIKIILQKTLDQRVENFLKNKFQLEVVVLKSYKTEEISGQKLTLIDCGTIDSSILVETDQTYHLNLNDCDFTKSQLKTIKDLINNHKKKVIVYMQFSYAAFRSNNEWLNKASKYKLEKLVEVYNFFNADLLIPFASFIYFSSPENFRLNKYMNTVKSTSDYLKKNNIKYCILNPAEHEINIVKIINDQNLRNSIINNSVNFWDTKIDIIKPDKEVFDKFEISQILKDNFLLRIKKKNTIFLMYIIRFLSLKYFFGDTIIHLNDKNETYILNFFNITRDDKISKKQIDLEMKSKRFFFMLKEAYGVDTITINGCFNNVKKNGFEIFIRSMGFVVLNQVDRGINLRDIFTNKMINRIEDIFLRLFKKNS